jgi:hypothetical protein
VAQVEKGKAVLDHDVKMRRGSRGIAPSIPNLGPGRKWLVNISARLLYLLFENVVLRRIFGPKRDEATGEWRHYIMRSLMVCTPHPILFG